MFQNHYGKDFLCITCMIIVLLLQTGCQSVVNVQNFREILEWNYSDLKVLDPIDMINPDQDLIAAYARTNNQSLQLAFDFLYLDKNLGKDLYIPLDTNPGGNTQIITNGEGYLVSDINWDYLIKITDAGDVTLLNNHYSVVDDTLLFVINDSEQDRIVIDISHTNIPISDGNVKFEVLITAAGMNEILDKSVPYSINSPSPARAKVLFAFWNTFSSTTPSQTIRSWAGAHAGPMSSRHGLKYLIDAAARTKSTIILLDLLTPKNISALDYLNVLPRIRNLAITGTLGLPGIGVDGKLIINKSIMDKLSISNATNIIKNNTWMLSNDLANLDIKSNPNFYVFLNNINNINKSFFDNGVIDYAQLNYKGSHCNLLPSYSNSDPPTSEKLSLECKKLLLSNAYDQPASTILLGGDFSKSILGDPKTSTEVFSYIASHPWIQVLTIQDLLTVKDDLSGIISNDHRFQSDTSVTTQHIELETVTSDTKQQNLVSTALLQSPPNQLSDLAWQVYYSLIEPASPELQTLHRNYMGQIGLILKAAHWADNPEYIQSCDLDLDFDGIPECILSNKQIFIIIESDGGYIPFIFTKDDKGIHQVVGPSWEFIVGLGDPSSWDANAGIRSDPAQILGAFQDQLNNWKQYTPKISEGKIELYSDSASIHKTIAIQPDQIHIDITNSSQSDLNPIIPLVVDPWQRYTDNWGASYTGTDTPLGFIWGITSRKMVGIYSTNLLNTYKFNQTRMALSKPEDPNFDYLRGHYLPYPMALVEFTQSGNISVVIELNP